jgi:hypothetical protein
MPREKASAEPSYGFLSTLESSDYGHFGGYLIVSPLGRPLEFHCTSPVRASRAQEILYGPTLKPYLVGEQISGALLKAAKSSPCLILADTAEMLLARSHANSPMAFIMRSADAVGEPVESQIDGWRQQTEFASSDQPSRFDRFDMRIAAGGYCLILPAGFDCERQSVAELATQLSQHIDLAEPFGRIHEAIREAQRIGGRGTNIHGQAA